MLNDINALRERIETLGAGLGMKNLDAVTEHLWTDRNLRLVSDLATDDKIRSLLLQSKGADAKGELFEQPKGAVAPTENGPQDPEFRAFLGGLALDFNRLAPAKRMGLWRQFQEQRDNPPQAAGERIERELAVRYGENWRDVCPKADLARLHDAKGLPRGPTTPQPAAIQVPSHLRGERKLQAYYLSRQIQDAEKRLLGETNFFTRQRIEGDIDHLKRRIGAMV